MNWDKKIVVNSDSFFFKIEFFNSKFLQKID